MANVVAIDVHVHERGEHALRTELLRKRGLTGEQVVQHRGHRAPAGGELSRPIDDGPKDRRDAYDAHAAPPNVAHSRSKASRDGAIGAWMSASSTSSVFSPF